MDANQEIEIGASICRKLQAIYFPLLHWALCSHEVSKKFTTLKQILRKFEPELNGIKLLQKIDEFSSANFKEAFSLEDDYLKKKEKVDNKYGEKVVWIPVPIDKPALLDEVRKLLADCST